MNKKLLSCMGAWALTTTVFAGTPQRFVVKGQLANIGDTLIVLRSAQPKLLRDTILVKKGKFEYTANIDKPKSVYFFTPATMRHQDHKRFTIVAVPGEEAQLKGDINTRYDITGSKFYQQYHQADLMMEAGQQKINALEKACDDRLSKGESRDAVAKDYDAQMPALEKEYHETVLNYIKAHPSEEASAAIIPELEDLDLMKAGVAALDSSVRDGRMKCYYQRFLDQAQKEKEEEVRAEKIQASGVEAKDFTLKDIDGKPFTLSSLRGKYVVIDFWGSWCYWCIKGMPEMRKYYAKYKDKLEIVGVDCQDTPEKWRAAVKKNGMTWKQVYCDKDSHLLEDYAISGFPTKILVDPQGKIVKTVVGEDPAFYELLDKTLE
ncbi:MAG: TlpA disulfide reductase family protein [Prevotella sp.]|nr:TlpA disulfide reductase family protein [Prevotella sp.]